MDRPIRVVGARHHHLADVSVEIPEEQLTVVTGVSGSGKSSLVLDTVAAESMRQLGETFPAFVRNRLAHRARPEVDALENLTAAVVVDQRPLGANSRSTVGTAAEIAPLLRLLWSRVATPWVGWSPAFSFNDPSGMCPRCSGLGTVDDIDVDALVDPDLSLDEGAIRFPSFAPGTAYWKRYVTPGLFDTTKPVRTFSEEERRLLLHEEGLTPPDPLDGWPTSSSYVGVLPRLRERYLTHGTGRVSAAVREALERVVTRLTCPECDGARLNAAARNATIDGRTLPECGALEVRELAPVIAAIDAPVAAPLVAAIGAGLAALVDVGLGYLSLDRATPTLSGGEAQRIKLVRHLGSDLTGLTYVFDEPSAGLHAREVDGLVGLLRRLRDQGNTVLVVEHDRDVIAAADHVIDMGPGAGAGGGRVLYAGDPAGLARADTPTGRHLARARRLDRTPRPGTGALTLTGVTRHTLRDVTVSLPRGALTAVTGVAGSGKSTLTAEIPGAVRVDQSPVRGSRRSTVASRIGVLDALRAAFARASGEPASLFSANGAGGCPVCRGLGSVETDLAFLDPVTMPCEACDATGFTAAARAHTLDGRTIDEVLALPVARAVEVLDRPELRALDDVGLGHLALGRALSTLSGGERQRLRLAGHLDADLLVLDEPTRGLHPVDVERLLGVLDRLVDDGATVVVVEHDLDVAARADHVIDMGPGAGRDGGRVLYSGPPAGLPACAESVTGRWLARESG